MGNVLKQIFEFISYFFAIISFWDMVDFAFNIRSELGTYDFWEPDSEMLTNDGLHFIYAYKYVSMTWFAIHEPTNSWANTC